MQSKIALSMFHSLVMTLCQQQPRGTSDSFFVNVKLKRTNVLKNVHSESLVRPTAIINALKKF